MRNMHRYAVAIIALMLVAMLCGCNGDETSSKCKTVYGSELVAGTEKLAIERNDGAFVAFDEKDYEVILSKMNKEIQISEAEYEGSIGVYVYRNGEDDYMSFPVYAKTIDDAEITFSDIDSNEVYLSGNIQPLEDNGRNAYYIVYSQKKSGRYDNIGTGFLKLAVEAYATKRELNDDETYDIFNGTFDFYPAEGVELEEYEVSLTLPMNDDDYSIVDNSILDNEEPDEPFVKHEIWMEILDNGYYWRGVELSSDISTPVRSEPWLIVHSKEGNSKVNSIDFSIQKLVFKKGMSTISSNQDIGTLSCSYRKHSFVE